MLEIKLNTINDCFRLSNAEETLVHRVFHHKNSDPKEKILL